MEISLTPQVTPEQAALLNRQVAELDRLLDNPYGRPQPIGQSGALEDVGRMLWDASGLEPEHLLDATRTARDTETPLRLVITDKAYYPWPWELLYHDHPQLGFVGRHPWCVVARRIRGDGRRTPRILPRPFRLLLFIASPEDLEAERSRLDFEREEELLYTALDGPWSRGEMDIVDDGSCGNEAVSVVAGNIPPGLAVCVK